MVALKFYSFLSQRAQHPFHAAQLPSNPMLDLTASLPTLAIHPPHPSEAKHSSSMFTARPPLQPQSPSSLPPCNRKWGVVRFRHTDKSKAGHRSLDPTRGTAHARISSRAVVGRPSRLRPPPPLTFLVTVAFSVNATFVLRQKAKREREGLVCLKINR